MPELTPGSTLPPFPSVAVPPAIDPDRFEAFPIFRETFLAYISDPGGNAALRGFGELIYRMTLEYWSYFPDQPEGLLRSNFRAAIGDMRHVQGYLAEWAGPDASHKTPHEEHLAKRGGAIARELGALADRLEEELGTWRG